MATSPRDVTMTLSVETLGEDGIKKLQQSVSNLAKEGGDAAPEFEALADEIGRLGQQAAALQAFEALAVQTAAIAQKQKDATTSAQELGARLDTLKAATDRAKESQKSVADQLREAQLVSRVYRDELASLEAETDKAVKKTAEYEAGVKLLKLAKIDQRAEVERLRTALTQETAAVSAAQKEQNALGAVYKNTAASATAATAALNAHEAQLREASTAAASLDVSTENLATSQAALVQAFNAAGNEAKAIQAQSKLLAAELEQVAIAAKQQEDALRSIDAERTEAEFRSLSDQSKLLAAEMEFAAESARLLESSQRDAAVAAAALKAAQSEETARKLAVAQGLLTTELELATAAAERAGQEHRDLVAAQQAAEAQTKELAAAAKEAADKIDNAFATVGVRSAQDLQAEIDQVRASMDVLRATAGTTGTSMAGAFAAGEARIKALERDIREVNGTLTMGDKAAKLFANSMGQITAGNIVADGVGYLVNKVKELGVAFLDAIVGGDQLKRGLNAIYKDAAVTASQIDFLRRSSSESGVAFGALSKEFVKFSAAMTSANIPLEQSNNLFKAVTAASASLGLSSEATTGSLNALGQMASKGVVSMEELRQQLGDRLPGALGLLAKGMGIAEDRLVELVSSGQLATRDFIVPFTNALAQMKGETDGLVPTWERFKGLLSEVAQGMGDAGATQVLTAALKILGGVVGFVALGLSTIVEYLGLVAKAYAALASRIMGNRDAWQMFAEDVEKASNRLNGQIDGFNAMLDPANAAAGAIGRNTAALTSNTAEAVKAINANEKLTGAQKLTALATTLAGDATLDAAAKLIQYDTAAGEFLDLQQAQIDALQKTAKATKQQGDTLVQLAQLTGDQTVIQEASIKSSQDYAAALDKVAAAQRDETAMLIAQRQNKIDDAILRDGTTDKVKVQILELEKKIAASQAETDQANAAAAALRAEITTRQLSAATYRDNTDAVGEYTAELERSKAALVSTENAVRLGAATEADLEEARKRVLNATVMLNDAERDRIATQQALTAEIRVNATLEQAGLNLQMAQLKAAADKAIADGNDYALRQSLIAQKELEIKIIRLKVEAQIAEQNALIAGIELTKADLEISDPLYKQRVAALDLSIKSAEAKILEAKAAGENVASMERELTALRNSTTAKQEDTAATRSNTDATTSSAAATNSLSDAYERLMLKYTMSHEYSARQIELLKEEAAAQQALIDLELKRLNIDKEKFSLDAQGNRISQAVGSRDTASAKLEGMGLDPATAKRLAAQVYDERGNYTPKSSGAYRSDFDTEDAVLQRLASQGGGASAIGRTVNVNLQVAGKTQTVATDESGASALVAALRQAGLTAS